MKVRFTRRSSFEGRHFFENETAHLTQAEVHALGDSIEVLEETRSFDDYQNRQITSAPSVRPLNQMTKKELVAQAKRQGLSVSERMTNKELITRLSQ